MASVKQQLRVHDGRDAHGDADGRLTTIDLRGTVPDGFTHRIWQSVRIELSSTLALQGLVAALRSLGRTHRVTVEIADRVPVNLLHPPVTHVDGRSVLEVSRFEDAHLTKLQLRLGWHAPVWSILAACMSTPLGAKPAAGSAIRLGYEPGIDPSWVGLTPQVFQIASDDHGRDSENPGPTPRTDIAFVAEQPVVGELSHEYVQTAIDLPGWRGRASADSFSVPPVETRIFTPIGFSRLPQNDWLYMRPIGEDQFALVDSAGVTRAVEREVTPHLVRLLRDHWGVVESGSAYRGPVERAHNLLRLFASGIPVVSPDAAVALRGWLPVGLLNHVLQSPEDLADTEDRERIAACQVRAVHENATWNAVGGVTASGGNQPAVSVVLATMRPDYVPHLLDSFFNQEWPQKELLLGMHGFAASDLPKAIQERLESQVTVVEWPDDGIFGDLLRELTNRSSGDIIAKMDDDDWYSRHHLSDLVHAMHYSGATLVGSGVQFVYMHNADTTIRRAADQAYKFGGHPGGPTFMIAKDHLLAAGNWPRVRRAVDTGLNEAVLAMGGNVYQSHAHNFLFNRRSAGHTWKASNEYFIARAIEQWYGLRPPSGFDGEYLPNRDWRSVASTIGEFDTAHKPRQIVAAANKPYMIARSAGRQPVPSVGSGPPQANRE